MTSVSELKLSEKEVEVVLKLIVDHKAAPPLLTLSLDCGLSFTVQVDTLTKDLVTGKGTLTLRQLFRD